MEHLLDNLIKIISKLPGLGPRSGRRIVLHLIKNSEKTLHPLIDLLKKVSSNIQICSECGNIDVVSPCKICTDHSVDHSILCIVEDVSDLWAMQRGQFFNGAYHILGGTLSALEGITPDKLNLESLKSRVANNNVKEVIIATNSTLDGQTTAFYIADMLKTYNIKVSRLASGIPIGAELDYLDEGTLALALKTRHDF